MSSETIGNLSPASRHRRFDLSEDQIFAEHLLAGCEQCLAQAAELYHASGRPILDEKELTSTEYEGAVSSAIQTSLKGLEAVRKDRGEAPQLLEELQRFPSERRLIVICNRRRFHSLGLCELLMSRSESHWFSSPSKAREEAELAVAVAENLNPDRHDLRTVSDLRARAWAYLGNANRILSDFRTAEANFCNAQDHLAQGTGSPADASLLGELRIALRLAQRRFEEVETLADEVAQIYRQIGDSHLLGRILIRKGTCRIHQEKWESAGRLLRQGLRLVDSQRDPRLALVGRTNLLFCLVEEGCLDEAREVLDEARLGYTKLGDPLSLARLRWLEGKIAMKEGDSTAAEMHLNETRQRFLDEGIGYETALVSLDLAKIYAEQGRHRELKVLAAAMVPIFQSRDIHEEALAALVLFHQAAKSEAVTLTLVGRLARYLETARSDPGLKFAAEGAPRSVR